MRHAASGRPPWERSRRLATRSAAPTAAHASKGAASIGGTSVPVRKSATPTVLDAAEWSRTREHAMTSRPTPFEVHESGALLHGTKANLVVGDLLVPGRPHESGSGRAGSPFVEGRALGAESRCRDAPERHTGSAACADARAPQRRDSGGTIRGYCERPCLLYTSPSP